MEIERGRVRIDDLPPWLLLYACYDFEQEHCMARRVAASGSHAKRRLLDWWNIEQSCTISHGESSKDTEDQSKTLQQSCRRWV